MEPMADLPPTVAKPAGSAGPLTHPGKRLVLFFDGTWNIPENNTNVWRLSLMLADKGEDGVPQEKFYDPGVGTHFYDRLTGGAFGVGLSENVRLGYRWLMERYNKGDEIFIFGFSRGAFTARSLAGIIGRCGLLRPDSPIGFQQLYERYQKGDEVRPVYQLKYLRNHGETRFDFEETVLLNYAHHCRNLIKMVGVWDTVGSLGIPFGNIKGVSRHTLGFHNTHLSKTVQHSYQALALDEYRGPYWAVLWTNFVPDRPEVHDAAPADNRYVEQRWFAGAHSNVGGGYQNDLLPQRPLVWLQEKARGCGLSFRSVVSVIDEDDLHMSPRDSYGEFLNGIWPILTLGKRHVRWVMSDPVCKEAHWKGATKIDDGWVETVNERIDMSVFRRCQIQPDYRPLSLVEWAERKKVDLKAIVSTPENYPALWSPVMKPGIETSLKPRNADTQQSGGCQG